MGIAVGILMGTQAAGAAVGGIVASAIGPPRAITGALVLAACFGAWAMVTTPVDAKHLAGSRRTLPQQRTAPAVPAVAYEGTGDGDLAEVVDLVSMEHDRRTPPAVVTPVA
jgi:hypothetical protein